MVGSGEYTPAMLEVEGGLLEGRPPRFVQIPTAASAEGEDRLVYWIELGQAQAARLGVTAVPLRVTSRADAEDPAIVSQLDGAGLIYLSGGSPSLLAATLRDTPLWRAIVAAWENGAALAGCSAGAMAMADHVPELRRPSKGGQPGLGLLPHIRVLPHFDRMAGWVPDVMTRPFFRGMDGVHVVGIDEDTAIVGGPEEFTVHGRQSAWLLSDGKRREFPAGLLQLVLAESDADWSAHAEQVDHEDERLAGLDGPAGTTVPVRQPRRDRELSAPADTHAGDALVPARYDLLCAEPEIERRLAAPGRVELLAGRERDADVVDDDGMPGLGLVAITDRDIDDLQIRGRVARGPLDHRLAECHGVILGRRAGFVYGGAVPAYGRHPCWRRAGPLRWCV